MKIKNISNVLKLFITLTLILFASYGSAKPDRDQIKAYLKNHPEQVAKFKQFKQDHPKFTQYLKKKIESDPAILKDIINKYKTDPEFFKNLPENLDKLKVKYQSSVVNKFEIAQIEDKASNQSYFTSMQVLGNQPNAALFGMDKASGKNTHPLVWYPDSSTQLSAVAALKPSSTFQGVANNSAQPSVVNGSQLIRLSNSTFSNPVFTNSAINRLKSAPIGTKDNFHFKGIYDEGSIEPTLGVINKAAHITLDKVKQSCERVTHNGTKGVSCTLRQVESVKGRLIGSGVQFTVGSLINNDAYFSVNKRWHKFGTNITASSFNNAKEVNAFFPSVTLEKAKQFAAKTELRFNNVQTKYPGDKASFKAWNFTAVSSDSVGLADLNLLRVKDVPSQQTYVTTDNIKGKQTTQSPIIFGQSSTQPAIWAFDGETNVKSASTGQLTPKDYFLADTNRFSAKGNEWLFQPSGSKLLRYISDDHKQFAKVNLGSTLLLVSPLNERCETAQVRGKSGKICTIRRYTQQGTQTKSSDVLMDLQVSDELAANNDLLWRPSNDATWLAMNNSVPLYQLPRTDTIDVFIPELLTNDSVSIELSIYNSNYGLTKDGISISLEANTELDERNLDNAFVQYIGNDEITAGEDLIFEVTLANVITQGAWIEVKAYYEESDIPQDIESTINRDDVSAAYKITMHSETGRSVTGTANDSGYMRFNAPENVSRFYTHIPTYNDKDYETELVDFRSISQSDVSHGSIPSINYQKIKGFGTIKPGSNAEYVKSISSSTVDAGQDLMFDIEFHTDVDAGEEVKLEFRDITTEIGQDYETSGYIVTTGSSPESFTTTNGAVSVNMPKKADSLKVVVTSITDNDTSSETFNFFATTSLSFDSETNYGVGTINPGNIERVDTVSSPTVTAGELLDFYVEFNGTQIPEGTVVKFEFSDITTTMGEDYETSGYLGVVGEPLIPFTTNNGVGEFTIPYNNYKKQSLHIAVNSKVDSDSADETLKLAVTTKDSISDDSIFGIGTITPNEALVTSISNPSVTAGEDAVYEVSLSQEYAEGEPMKVKVFVDASSIDYNDFTKNYTISVGSADSSNSIDVTANSYGMAEFNMPAAGSKVFVHVPTVQDDDTESEDMKLGAVTEADGDINESDIRGIATILPYVPDPITVSTISNPTAIAGEDEVFEITLTGEYEEGQPLSIKTFSGSAERKEDFTFDYTIYAGSDLSDDSVSGTGSSQYGELHTTMPGTSNKVFVHVPTVQDDDSEAEDFKLSAALDGENINDTMTSEATILPYVPDDIKVTSISSPTVTAGEDAVYEVSISEEYAEGMPMKVKVFVDASTIDYNDFTKNYTISVGSADSSDRINVTANSYGMAEFNMPAAGSKVFVHVPTVQDDDIESETMKLGAVTEDDGDINDSTIRGIATILPNPPEKVVVSSIPVTSAKAGEDLVFEVTFSGEYGEGEPVELKTSEVSATFEDISNQYTIYAGSDNSGSSVNVTSDAQGIANFNMPSAASVIYVHVPTIPDKDQLSELIALQGGLNGDSAAESEVIGYGNIDPLDVSVTSISSPTVMAGQEAVFEVTFSDDYGDGRLVQITAFEGSATFEDFSNQYTVYVGSDNSGDKVTETADAQGSIDFYMPATSNKIFVHIDTVQDDDEAGETFDLKVGLNGDKPSDSSVQGVATITPYTQPSEAEVIDISAEEFTEGEAETIDLTLSEPLDAGGALTFKINNLETKNEDFDQNAFQVLYGSNFKPITFGADGLASITFEDAGDSDDLKAYLIMKAVDDGVVEGDEHFVLEANTGEGYDQARAAAEMEVILGQKVEITNEVTAVQSKQFVEGQASDLKIEFAEAVTESSELTLKLTNVSTSNEDFDESKFKLNYGSQLLTPNFNSDGEATVTLASGEATHAFLILEPIEDGIEEDLETFTISANFGGSYDASTAVTNAQSIQSQIDMTPDVSVTSVQTVQVREGALAPINITLSDSPDTDTDLSFKFAEGTATLEDIDENKLVLQAGDEILQLILNGNGEGTVTLPAGTPSTFQLYVEPIDDGIEEEDETFTISANTGSNFDQAMAQSGDITIIGDIEEVTNEVTSVAEKQFVEGQVGDLRVEFAEPVTQDSELTIKLTNGTTSNEDFDESEFKFIYGTQILTPNFNANGEATLTLTEQDASHGYFILSPKDDGVEEEEETFTVSANFGASYDASTAKTGNESIASQVSNFNVVSLDAADVDEGNNAEINISFSSEIEADTSLAIMLTLPGSQAASKDDLELQNAYLEAGGQTYPVDLSSTSGLVNFTSDLSTTSAILHIPTVLDSEIEEDELFNVSANVGESFDFELAKSTQVTIKDVTATLPDITVTSVQTAEIHEGVLTGLNITLSDETVVDTDLSVKLTEGTATVDDIDLDNVFIFANGSPLPLDLNANGEGTVTLPAGTPSALQIYIQAINDELDEVDETFILSANVGSAYDAATAEDGEITIIGNLEDLQVDNILSSSASEGEKIPFDTTLTRETTEPTSLFIKLDTDSTGASPASLEDLDLTRSNIEYENGTKVQLAFTGVEAVTTLPAGVEKFIINIYSVADGLNEETESFKIHANIGSEYNSEHDRVATGYIAELEQADRLVVTPTNELGFLWSRERWTFDSLPLPFDIEVNSSGLESSSSFQLLAQETGNNVIEQVFPSVGTNMAVGVNVDNTRLPKDDWLVIAGQGVEVNAGFSSITGMSGDTEVASSGSEWEAFLTDFSEGNEENMPEGVYQGQLHLNFKAVWASE